MLFGIADTPLEQLHINDALQNRRPLGQNDCHNLVFAGCNFVDDVSNLIVNVDINGVFFGGRHTCSILFILSLNEPADGKAEELSLTGSPWAIVSIPTRSKPMAVIKV